jgi:hypothetical protein
MSGVRGGDEERLATGFVRSVGCGAGGFGRIADDHVRVRDEFLRSALVLEVRAPCCVLRGFTLHRRRDDLLLHSGACMAVPRVPGCVQEVEVRREAETEKRRSRRRIPREDTVVHVVVCAALGFESSGLLTSCHITR